MKKLLMLLEKQSSGESRKDCNRDRSAGVDFFGASVLGLDLGFG